MKLTDELCNHIFSEFPIEIKRHLIAIQAEFRFSVERDTNWPEDKIHAAAIVGEQANQLTQAALKVKYEKGQYYSMHKEAIQVGAMSLRFLLNAPEKPFKD